MKKKLFFKWICSIAYKFKFNSTLSTVFLLFFVQVSLAQTWSVLASEEQISSTEASYTDVTVLNDAPYVVYRASGVAKVKYKNLSTGNWEQVGNDVGANVTHTRIYHDNSGQLWVSYVDADNGYKLAVKKYNSTSFLWEPLNADVNNLYVSTDNVNYNESRYSQTNRSSLVFDANNTPYVAYAEGANLTPFVKTFDGTQWVAVGSGAVDAAQIAVGPSVVVDEENNLWLTFSSLSTATSTTGTMALYYYSGGSWSPITASVTSGIRHTTMILNASNNPVIGFFNTGDTNRANSVEYNRATSSWESTKRFSNRDATNIGFAKDSSGNLYSCVVDKYASSSYLQVARVFKLEVGADSWIEIKEESSERGVAEATGNTNLTVFNDEPVVVYTIANSNDVRTPVVRKFTPPADPGAVATVEVTGVSSSGATIQGNITADGGSGIAERGVVYGVSSNPNIDDDTKVIEGGTATGTYTVTLSNLEAASYINVRAYIINGGGTVSYGESISFSTYAESDEVVTGPKQVEFLNRGLVAVKKASNQVFLSWRLLATDPSNIAFNVYRNDEKVNISPITNSTNLIDFTTENAIYTVKSVIDGMEIESSKSVSVWGDNYMSVPLQIPPGGTTSPDSDNPNGKDYTYTANDASVGDMDGDGEYEIVLKWSPTALNHNSGGASGQQIFDCYKLDGTLLWRINLGNNINSGPHMNQFAVYDFDGDGKAEVALRTADGTVDGVGNVIGDPNADYRLESGWVQSGPAWLTIFNGITGAAMASVPYEPNRGHPDDWRDGGNGYGNRQDRLLMAVAYLDGTRPSIITGRGYYDKLVRAAYDWRDGELTLRWIFDSKDPTQPANNAYSGQGNHQLTIGDVDGDGKDEVINGSSAINDDGTRLWSNGNGHGDALHMSDMDPDRPGLEIWIPLESPSQYAPYGIRLLDAKTGETIYGVETTGDVGRGLASDVDPNHKGYEMWASSGNFYNVQEGEIGESKPVGGIQAVNSAVWWDGDLGRELLDRTIIDKWNPETKGLNRLWTIYNDHEVTTNNSTKQNACLSADLFGDWREEIMFRKSNNTALIIVTTDIPTQYRIPTLMHDPQYRTAIAWQNNDYNQPPHPSFFLGYDMDPLPASNIFINEAENLAPTAVDDEITTSEGGTTSSLVGGAFSLLDNDTDPEKNNLTVELVTDVTNGTLTLKADGTFTYIHNGASNSTEDSFTYKATDGVSYSNVATVSIAVSELSIPYDNFTIRTTSETCADHDNGTLTLNAVQTHYYVVNLNGTDYSFESNSLTIDDLAPGTYPVCITIQGSDYEQCFTITIDEAASLLSSSKVTINEIALEIEEGTAPYSVYVNGDAKLETSSKNFIVSVKQGDLVEVKTAKPCEGTYTEKILDASEYTSAYPNPTNGVTDIFVPTNKNEVVVELYSIQGKKVLSGVYPVVNQKVQLDIEKESSGVYVARIEAESPLTLTIVKK